MLKMLAKTCVYENYFVILHRKIKTTNYYAEDF